MGQDLRYKIKCGQGQTDFTCPFLGYNGFSLSHGLALKHDSSQSALTIWECDWIDW